MRSKYVYEYPRPMVTVDIVVFTREETGGMLVLLIERKKEPFKGHWAIPGGFVGMEESLEEAAERELREETGVEGVKLKQFHAFGDPERDPRGRVITVAYAAVVKREDLRFEAGSDAAGAELFPVDELPPLAFDHADILEKAVAFIGETSNCRKG